MSEVTVSKISYKVGRFFNSPNFYFFYKIHVARNNNFSRKMWSYKYYKTTWNKTYRMSLKITIKKNSWRGTGTQPLESANCFWPTCSPIPSDIVSSKDNVIFETTNIYTVQYCNVGTAVRLCILNGQNFNKYELLCFGVFFSCGLSLFLFADWLRCDTSKSVPQKIDLVKD